MFSQVYWHHAVRAQKAMFFRAVMALLSELSTESALEQFRSGFVTMVSELPESLYREDREPDLFTASADPQDENPNSVGSSRMTLSAFRTGTDLMPTDAAVLSWFHQRLRDAERPESVLVEGILKRKLFKRLWVLNFEMEPTRWKRIVELWDQLDRGKRHVFAREFEKAISTLLSPERTASVTQMKASDAREQIAEWTAGEIPWLLVDIPGSRPGSEVGLYYVLEGQRRQLRKDDRAVGTPQGSTVWERYARDLRQVAGKIRVFCDEALVDTVEASIEWEDGIGELEDALVRVLS